MKHSSTAGEQWAFADAERQPAGERCLPRFMEKGFKGREKYRRTE